MKRLILITGDLATGKSTLAGILSERYGYPAFCKDKIKELLCDTVGFANREENLRLSRATMEVMTYNFKVLAGSGENLILEANFRTAEMEKIHKIANEYGYSVLTLVLSADIDILYKRFVTRIEKENRHPAHTSGFTGYEDFKSYVEGARLERIFGDVKRISADDFLYQTDSILFDEIENFLGRKI